MDNTTEDILDTYFSAVTMLSNHIPNVYDLDDMRDEKWNGDVTSPAWDKAEDEDDFCYQEQGIDHIKKGDLYFIHMYLSTGDKCWAVFREQNIIK